MADPTAVRALYARCPVASETPLLDVPDLAAEMGVESLHLKDERARMGLGSFKALGAACVIAREAVDVVDDPEDESISTSLSDRVFVCASAGNHGLSVAAGARAFGARAIVYLSETVPEAFEERLAARGAETVRWGRDYEESMFAAARDAGANGWTLLSDSSWPGYVDIPSQVMEGYLIMGAEIRAQLSGTPTHVFLQAGVGGMAAAMAAFVRAAWGDEPLVVVTEPAAAPALLESIRAGGPVLAPGPSSIMGRLDCKEPSHLALAELARSADWFTTITDEEVASTVDLLEGHHLPTTPSGAAGLAALHHLGSARDVLGIGEGSRVLAILTEERASG